MYSTNKTTNRKEKILEANRILLLLDNNDFGGNVKFSFKQGCGLMTYIIEEYGSFYGDNKSKSVAVDISKKNNYLPK